MPVLIHHKLLGCKPDIAYFHRFVGHHGQRKLAIIIRAGTFVGAPNLYRGPEYWHPVTGVCNLTGNGQFLENTEKQYFVVFHTVIDTNWLEDLMEDRRQVAIKRGDLDFTIVFDGRRAVRSEERRVGKEGGSRC